MILLRQKQLSVGKRHMRSIGQNGFTLVELMVTIAVMGIIAVMAAPSFSDMLQKQNLNKSSKQLIAVLSKARSQAALERSRVTVNLNSTAADTADTLNWSPSGKSALKSTTTTLVFLPTGLVDGVVGDVNFTICDNSTNAKYSKNISISRMGTVQQPIDGVCT